MKVSSEDDYHLENNGTKEEFTAIVKAFYEEEIKC